MRYLIQAAPAVLALLLAAPARALPLTGPLENSGAPSAQDEEKKPDKREEIKEMLSTFKSHVSKRGDEDAEAISIIDQLLQEFPESGPKDRKAIVKELGACFKLKRKMTKEGLLDNKLFNACAISMGRMGPESVSDLAKWSEHKNFDKNYEVKTNLIKSLGMTASEDAIAPLLDLLPHHEAKVQAAAAEALSHFGELELKKRKKVFKKILDELTRVKNMIDVDQVDPIERKRYDVIASPMLTTLQVLSGQDDIRDPLKFRTWWNKNKKNDWDEGKND